MTARRDAYVAGFALLAAMGQAEARDLGLDGGPLYDPVAQLQARAPHASTTSAATASRQPVATRTDATAPAQDAGRRRPIRRRIDPTLDSAG